MGILSEEYNHSIILQTVGDEFLQLQVKDLFECSCGETKNGWFRDCIMEENFSESRSAEENLEMYYKDGKLGSYGDYPDEWINQLLKVDVGFRTTIGRL